VFSLLLSASESPNILRVPLDELVIGTVAFGIVFGLLAKFVFPRVNKTLEARANEIEGGIQRAASAQQEAQAALAQYNSQLAEARSEASAIRAAATDEKRAVIEQAKVEAQAAAATVTARAQEQVALERSQAQSSLEREVGALALDLASRVVGESLKDDARSRAVIDAFIADLERQAAEGR